MSSASLCKFIPCICRGGGWAGRHAPSMASDCRGQSEPAHSAGRWKGRHRPKPLHRAATRRRLSAGAEGFESLRRSAEHGFTLIEMLVALAIFSLAALALMRLETATAATTARLQDQALAQMVARNIAVETMTDPVPPAFGEASGETVNAGRRWIWTRRTGRSPEPRIQQILIHVARVGGAESATLTIFRRAPQ